MTWDPFHAWISSAPLLTIGALLFGAMCLAALIGVLLNQWHAAQSARSTAADESERAEGQEGYIVSAVLGLLALLMGFTFSLAVDRFETRRHLVLEEANAIGTTYLRAQLLPEPHRARMTDILVRYTDNRILLARAGPAKMAPFLATNDALVTDMWAATSSAFEVIKTLDFSSTYVDSVNAVIDLDASRKTARASRVPPEVFVVLFIYLFVTAGVLGYVLKGSRGRLSAGFLLALLTLSLLLIIDVDRPLAGGVIEGQAPMEALRASFSQPTSAYDKWR
ncbi:MAG TPA: hypothetical protein VM471_11430 [Phenylobacterium sp.]|nr:hypothetical protein [Phenylobacterium sp.]